VVAFIVSSESEDFPWEAEKIGSNLRSEKSPLEKTQTGRVRLFRSLPTFAIAPTQETLAGHAADVPNDVNYHHALLAPPVQDEGDAQAGVNVMIVA